jgi:hypothetical protein
MRIHVFKDLSWMDVNDYDPSLDADRGSIIVTWTVLQSVKFIADIDKWLRRQL